MGIRETMNKKPGLTSGIVIAIIVLALALVVYELSPKGAAPLRTGVYYSDDDGKTFYIDSMSNLPPYDHDGKQAVLAHVYHCGSNPPFVGFLQKYTDDMRERLAHPIAGDDVDPNTGTQVKRPGDTDWVMMGSHAGSQIIKNIQIPSGETGPALQIIPGVPTPGQ